jgi:hypothetical protein
MRILLLGSISLNNGSGCGFGRPKNIRYGSECRIRILNAGIFTSFFKDKKSIRRHKIVEIKVFLYIFA